MTKTSVFLVIIALRIFYQPGNAQASIAPFTSQPPLFTTVLFNSSAKLVNFTGNFKNNKVFLEWMVVDNEAADQFEIEKSTDGKNFRLAALVFGTDIPKTGKYVYYENTGHKKIMYRIKMIQKNKKAEYSPVVEVIPNA
ncbi:MAG TPA: hypothetical protein VMZ03_06825 [Chitinophagaceae bacterium]|nr:hypothetical protein [Chitinophagaceae bacterium]